jgi:signal transduction histidine kinase
VPEAVLEGLANSPEQYELTREAGACHYLAVPIRSREKVLGAIAFFSSSGEAGFRLGDQAFAEEIGRRVGVSIENSLLYEQAREAIRSREEFLSIASHELKTPICSLRLQLQMAKRSLQEPKPSSLEQCERLLGTSVSQVDRLTRLVEDLLDLGRIQTGKISFEFEEVDLSGLVHDVVGRYSDPLREAACPVSVAVDEGLRGRADRGRLEQVLVNLISNVIKYAPGAPVEVSLRRLGGQAELTVRDGGPGIPANRISKIFDRFERGDQGRGVSGLGLGLYITRQIVEGHGGSILAKSELGRGSSITVILPLGS